MCVYRPIVAEMDYDTLHPLSPITWYPSVTTILKICWEHTCAVAYGMSLPRSVYSAFVLLWCEREGAAALGRPPRFLSSISDYCPVPRDNGAARSADLLSHAFPVCHLWRLSHPCRARSASVGHLRAHRHTLAAPHSPVVPALRQSRSADRPRGRRAPLPWHAGVTAVSVLDPL